MLKHFLSARPQALLNYIPPAIRRFSVIPKATAGLAVSTAVRIIAPALRNWIIPTLDSHIVGPGFPSYIAAPLDNAIRLILEHDAYAAKRRASEPRNPRVDFLFMLLDNAIKNYAPLCANYLFSSFLRQWGRVMGRSEDLRAIMKYYFETFHCTSRCYKCEDEVSHYTNQ